MKKLFASIVLACAACAAFAQVVIPAGTSLNITSVTSAPSGGTPAFGPGSSTNNAWALWNGTSGNLLKNSDVTYSSPTLTVPAAFGITGAGSLAFTAGGSNQSITLAPSGTGSVLVTSASTTGSSGQLQVQKTGSSVIGNFYAGTAGVFIGVTNAAAGFGIEFGAATGVSAPVQMKLTTTGNLLLGGLTTDGTGVLQFPAGAADNTSGGTYGADTNFYRTAAGILNVNAVSGTAVGFNFRRAASVDGVIVYNSGALSITTNSAASIILATNNIAALTLDSSQNTTAAGDVKTSTIGKTFYVKSGSNAKAGTFTLSSGAATVANTSVTANSVIDITIKTSSGTPGAYRITGTVVGTSFTVAGLATDNSTYNYIIFEVN